MVVNRDQRDYWSGAPGKKWLTFEDGLDTVFRNVNKAILSAAQPLRGARMLDIGCGTGALSLDCAALSVDGTVTGIDISAPLLDRARTRAAHGIGAAFRLADAQEDKIDGGPFDLCVSRFGVMFFSDPVAAFVNLRQHMAPGGRAVLFAWAPMAVNPWFGIPSACAIHRLGPVPQSPSHAPGPLGWADLDYATGLLRSAGWSEVEGTEVVVDLHHPDGHRAAAHVAASVGPAARVLKHHEGSAADEAAIAAAVEAAFAAFDTPDGFRLPARLHQVTARAPG